MASGVARIILDSVRRLRSTGDRKLLSREDRLRLLDLAGLCPRCWICGARFVEEAIDNFLYRQRNKLALPPFVDILKPRDLVERDVAVEVDHVVPHSHGGDDNENLWLACGWCNQHKGAYVSIYEVEGCPKSTGTNSVGASSLPQPFWTVRVLATTLTCEHPEGCSRSATDASITVAPIVENGALNPMNFQVTCSEHDPYQAHRLQSQRVARKVWSR